VRREISAARGPVTSPYEWLTSDQSS